MADFDQPKKTARGGARRGAGRPRGAPNKATAERYNEIAASGETPLDIMIETMRYHFARGKELKKDRDHDRSEVSACLAAACNVAEKAAPYVHPKLASIVSKVEQTSKAADVNDARNKLQSLLGHTDTGATINGSGKPN